MAVWVCMNVHIVFHSGFCICQPLPNTKSNHIYLYVLCEVLFTIIIYLIKAKVYDDTIILDKPV